jgi:starch synthase
MKGGILMAEKAVTKVLIAASEFEPFTNIGHLGRVVSYLSVALNNAAKADGEDGCQRDIDLRVVLPRYAGIPHKYLDAAKPLCEFAATLGRRTYPCSVSRTIYRGVIVYFVSCGNYFEQNQVYSTVGDDVERFSCFCNAVLVMLPRIGFIPDIIQCHDWQMSYIPTLYKTNRSRRASDISLKTLFVIHSMQYQGICSRYDMLDLLDLSSEFFTSSTLEFYGQANSLKGGLIFSDRLVTVSPNYAREIQHAYYGENLEGIIRSRSYDISGVLCGIDPQVYNPATDMRIHEKYDADTIHERKQKNKLRLQELLGFDQNEDIPLIIVISDELDYDKGVDLIKFVFDDIVGLGIQLVIASKGKSDYHDFFKAKSGEYESRVAYVRYNGGIFWDGEKWSSWEEFYKDNGLTNYLEKDPSDTFCSMTETMLICGSDLLLRPSRIEPCGEKHLIALKYGTLPIVRETGGLKDAVVSYNSESGEGNGFSFFNYNAHDMLFTIGRAVDIFKNDREAWQKLVGAAMKVNRTWDDAAAEYTAIYKSLSEAR